MPKIITVLRIFVASPSDLDEERKLLEGVIEELNLIWLQQKGISFELIKWETHSYPSAGTDPQDVINNQLSADYDIFLGMFWSRIGKPTQRSKSGTLEEFDIAYRKWKCDPLSTRLMIYFKTTPISPDDIDPDQLKQLKEFRNSLSEKGVLYKKFTSNVEFSRLLRIHLSKQAQDFIKTIENVNKPENNPTAIPLSSGTHLEKSMKISEDEGFLDLIETTVISFQKTSEVTKHIMDALKILTDGTKQSTIEIQSINVDEKSKLAVYKSISNKQADNMADFVSRMRPEILILDGSLTKALDAYERILSLLPDFGSDSDNHSQLENALSSSTQLKDVMILSKNSIERFRTSIAVLPRITTQFNHAKRDLLSLLDMLLTIYTRGINMLGEIETTGKSILDS